MINDLHRFLLTDSGLWYASIFLTRKFGREQINELNKENLITIREGLNLYVVALTEKTETKWKQ
jgi:hypothetical protein